MEQIAWRSMRFVTCIGAHASRVSLVVNLEHHGLPRPLHTDIYFASIEFIPVVLCFKIPASP